MAGPSKKVMETIRVREAHEGDYGLITKTWVETYVESRFARDIRPSIYFDRQKRLIRAILDRPTVHAVVASLPDDDVTVLAWAVVEHPDVAHYVFTKREFRRFGLATHLLSTLDGSFRYSHRTPFGEPLIRSFKKVQKRAIYDPYAAWRLR